MQQASANMHLLFWVSPHIWSSLALGVYSHTAKPGYSYRRVINISVLVCFVFDYCISFAQLPVMFIFYAALSSILFLLKSRRSEAAATYCELCTIEWQRCVAGVAARRPQQAYMLNGSAACQRFGPSKLPLGFSWLVIGHLAEAARLQVVHSGCCIKGSSSPLLACR